MTIVSPALGETEKENLQREKEREKQTHRVAQATSGERPALGLPKASKRFLIH